MEISSLDEDLLKEKEHQLFDFFLHFTQSEQGEEQRLATRALSKLPLAILQDRNPRILGITPQEQPKMAFTSLEGLNPKFAQNPQQKTIKEEITESSVSDVSSKSFSESEFEREDSKEVEVNKQGNIEETKEAPEDTKRTTNENKKKSKSETSMVSSSNSSDSDNSSSEKSMSPIGSKGSIHSFISSLSLKIKPRNNADSDIQYFSLYSIFNLLLQININNGQKVSQEEEARKESVPMKEKFWNDLSVKEFNSMLIECGLVNHIIALMIKSKDDDVIRISLKIIILLTFKVPIKEFLKFGGGSEKLWIMSCLSNDTENYNYCNFQSFLGYVLHRSKKEDIDITSFMPVESINSFILKLCNDFREDELLELNVKGNNSKKKLIIYKFFFVSYLISLLTKILDQKCDKIEIDIRLGVKQLCYNFIEICQSIHISDLGLSKLLQNIEEQNKKREERYQLKIEGRSSIIGVIVSLCMKTIYIECLSSNKNEDKEDLILDKRATNVIHDDPKEEKIRTLNKKTCQLVLNNLTKYEDVGEIIDTSYKYLCCFFENVTDDIKQEYTELLENSKVLVTQAVKHVAVYKSESALKFINLLIKSSSKYKNKQEIENALRNLMSKGRMVKK